VISHDTGVAQGGRDARSTGSLDRDKIVTMIEPVVIRAGTMAYTQALELQLQTHARVLSGELPGALIVVEHEPVITVSQRQSASSHLLASPAKLSQLGIAVEQTDRGGDITYHGPGQLVVYPILRLNDYALNVGRYMRLLELAVIDALATQGVTGVTEQGNTGVWVEDGADTSAKEPTHSTSPSRKKICALGVRVRQSVTLHGLALNVTTDLTHFNTIVPCGLPGREVTSLQELLGSQTPTMQRVEAEVVRSLRAQLSERVQTRRDI
jgi:lipoyl(octanoyl) transferase